MKSTFYFLSVLAILCSCNGSEPNANNANAEANGMQSTSNRANAMMGIYAGAQPCSDCDRIHTMMSLIENNKGWIKELKLGKTPEERRTIEGSWKIEGSELLFQSADNSYSRKFQMESDSVLALIDEMCRPDSKPKTCVFKKIKNHEPSMHNDSIVAASEGTFRNMMQQKRDSIQQARAAKNQEALEKAKVEAQKRADENKEKLEKKRQNMESKIKKP